MWRGCLKSVKQDEKEAHKEKNGLFVIQDENFNGRLDFSAAVFYYCYYIYISLFAERHVTFTRATKLNVCRLFSVTITTERKHVTDQARAAVFYCIIQ